MVVMLQRRDSGKAPKTSGTSNLRFASMVDHREVLIQTQVVELLWLLLWLMAARQEC